MISNENLVAVLGRMQDAEGRLTPIEVVRRARRRNHELHDEFTWDDNEAAIQHRLRQARTLISRVRLEVTIHRQTVSVVGYFRDPDLPPDEQGYVARVRLRERPNAANLAVVAELTRVTAYLRRARDAAPNESLSDEVVEILGTVTGLIDRLA